MSVVADRITASPLMAIELIQLYLKCGLVPILRGSPGIGKSDIVHQVALMFNLLVIDLRVAQCDPTDFLGFPTVIGDRSGYLPMNTFPLEGDPLPVNPVTGHKYSGWLIFFDEFTSGSMAVQAAAYKVILDRLIAQRKLHKNVAMVCAGNKETDNAIVQPMSTALQSRLVHIDLEVSHFDWCDWAYKNGIDIRITDFVRFMPDMMYTFKPDHTDNTYASPRTWSFANRLLDGLDLHSGVALPLLAGTLSQGVARSFIGYCDVYAQLPKMSAIKASPKIVPVPDEPSVLYALTGALSHHAKNDASFDPLMEYIERMPDEFQAIALRETVRRDKTMNKHKAVVKWIATKGVELY